MFVSALMVSLVTGDTTISKAEEVDRFLSAITAGDFGSLVRKGKPGEQAGNPVAVTHPG
jgi:hypothetical protein